MRKNGICKNENLPPEGVEQNPPCLIGGFSDINVVCPPYWNKIVYAKSRQTYSVDMVRLSLQFPKDSAQKLIERIDNFMCDESTSFTSKIIPGRYYCLSTYKLGKSSVTLGVGFIDAACRLSLEKGFVEFNPNKVAGDFRFWSFLEKIKQYARSAELKRFDLAVDVSLTRESVRLVKDKRTYKCVISNGITQYLGQKNAPGYVKVYDKAAELGLEGELTRIELTCDGAWSSDQIRKHFPLVHGWKAEKGTTGLVLVLASVLAEKLDDGKDIESDLAQIDYRTRAKIRKLIKAPRVEANEKAVELVLSEAKNWEW